MGEFIHTYIHNHCYSLFSLRFDTLQAVKAQWKAKGGRKSDLKSVILFEVFVALFNINDQGKRTHPSIRSYVHANLTLTPQTGPALSRSLSSWLC